MGARALHWGGADHVPNLQPATPAPPAPAAAGYPSYSEISGRSHHQDMEKLDQEWRARLEDLANQNKQLYKLATDKFTGWY